MTYTNTKEYRTYLTANNETVPIVIDFYGRKYKVDTTPGGGIRMTRIKEEENNEKN